MDAQIILYSSLSALILYLVFKFIFPSKKPQLHNHLPPGPPYLPIIGHSHILKPPFHLDQLLNLANEYGPVMSFWLGPRLTIFVSSASAAKECFTKNDIVLANRPQSPAGKLVAYDHTALGAAPYGDHWLKLRRIVTDQLLSLNQISSSKFVQIRKDEAKFLLLKISSKAGGGDDFARVELRSMLWNNTYNVIMRMVTGQEHEDDSEKGKELKKLIEELSQLDGFRNGMNVFFNWITGRYMKKVKNLAKRIDFFLQMLLDEHRSKKDELKGEFMITNLLSLQESEPDYYTNEIIKGILLDVVIAGADTTGIALEWAMSNLLNHPSVLIKAKEEIDAQVGKERLLDESDLPKLHYLQNIMWETLRLYPTFPLLIPHESSKDCTISGYHVPRGTMVVVSAYAIHRDPKSWDDPTSFRPERFEEGEQEGYKLLPFGLGRRSCPGSRLAQRVVSLTLGSLIQCFEWRRIGEELIDMTGGEGLTMPKAQQLEATCKARPIFNKVLNAID